MLILVGISAFASAVIVSKSIVDNFASVCLGGRGRLRIFRQAAAGHALLGAKLLRRIRQRGRNDVRRRNANVLLSGNQINQASDLPLCWSCARSVIIPMT